MSWQGAERKVEEMTTISSRHLLYLYSLGFTRPAHTQTDSRLSPESPNHQANLSTSEEE
jgi:hypothetical protein